MRSVISGRVGTRSRGDERGFTLIELLIVVIMTGILVMIALPSYLAFRTRANDATAKSNLTVAVNAISAYYADNVTYVGMTLNSLKTSYDQALDTTKYVVPAGDLTATSYCLQSTSGTRTWRKNGPAAAYENLTCP